MGLTTAWGGGSGTASIPAAASAFVPLGQCTWFQRSPSPFAPMKMNDRIRASVSLSLRLSAVAHREQVPEEEGKCPAQKAQGN